MTSYIVVPREGYYGATLKVASSHNTAASALREAGKWAGYRVLICQGKKKGDQIPRGVLFDMLATGHWKEVSA